MWAWAHNLRVTRTSDPTAPRLLGSTGRRWYVAQLGSDLHSLNAFGTGGVATWAGSGSPRLMAQVEGPQGAQSASLPWVLPVPAAQAATARVDEGAQRAPHPNGLSVGGDGGGKGQVAADRPPRVTHKCTKLHGAVVAQVFV